MMSISRTPSIYQIRHIESGKVYVGSAVNPRDRLGLHVRSLTNGIHHSRHLQRAWDKYGKDAFVFEIIEPVLFIEDLITREQYWIDTLRASESTRGFNTSPTAGSTLGMKHSDEVRAANAERGKAQFSDPEARFRQSERAKRQAADPEYRARMAESMKAYYTDPVHRQRLADQSKALASDPDERARISARSKAVWSDPEYRARISAAKRAQWEDPIFRERQMETRRQRGKEGDLKLSVRKRGPSDTRIKHGESNGSSKFTTEQVLEMRQKYDNREATAREIAHEVGGSMEYIRAILNRRAWKHIP